MPHGFRKCFGCRQIRLLMSPPVASCKKLRLCDQFDARIPNLIVDQGSRTIRTCTTIHRQLGFGHSLAKRFVEGDGSAQSPLFPWNAAEFLEALKRLHWLIFARGLPHIAGRFRQAGEPVSFGRDGRHQLTGADPSTIEERLVGIYAAHCGGLAAGLPPPRLARVCAQFLEEFFLVHPFVDGNGRVGRIVVNWMCAPSKLRLRHFETTKSKRRRYVRALERAHRHACVAPQTGYDPDPLASLAQWILEHLEPLPDEQGAEANPPEEEPGSGGESG